MRLRRDLIDRPARLTQRSGDGVQPFRVHAKVGLSDARARAHRHGPVAARRKLNVVNVALLERLELDVQVGCRLLDDLEASAVYVGLPRLVCLHGRHQRREWRLVVGRRLPRLDQRVDAREYAVRKQLVSGGREAVRLAVARAQPLKGHEVGVDAVGVDGPLRDTEIFGWCAGTLCLIGVLGIVRDGVLEGRGWVARSGDAAAEGQKMHGHSASGGLRRGHAHGGKVGKPLLLG
mmetsp:Transcript_3913/g.8892  ORF Transcript_3913/g.8892 Transcript_3913/m.8892 type:complete len:234 (+) Transcript_3913:439-1140(+)